MAFVRGKSTLDTPGVDTNIGKEKREQDESRQHASDVNKGLAESGVSFDSRTQVIDASGYSNARRPYDQYIRENPLAGTIAGQVDVVVNNYSPKVRVNDAGTGLVLSGTKTALESDYAKELRSFLTDALQYQDLRSQNVADAIEKINNDIRQQIERSVVEGGLKTNYDTYKDYAHALEVTTSTNPMKKAGDKNKIFGLLKDGTIDYKTPKDWEDYYRKNYSTADRANLYKNALARYKDFSSGAIDDATEIDLALITPYLVMSGGGRATETNAGMPIYGFDAGERLGALGESFLNEIGRLIEGGARAVWETVAPALNLGRYKASRVRDISSVFGVDSVDSEQIPWESEENYTNKINSLIGKNVNELTDDEKVFMAASFTLNSMGDWGETDKSYAENVLDYITNDNGEITEDINRVTGYDSYIHSRDSLSTTEKYTEEVEEKSKQLASGRDWLQERVNAASVYAPISSSLGAMAGTLMRMWAESAIISTATGGLIAPAMISDSIADGIIKMLGKASTSSMTATAALQTLQHPVGKFILSVVAELPEDVVQTVIDDVMTGRAEDIVQLAPTGDANKDMEKLGESFAQNLAFRLAFTPIHAGAKTLKDWRAARAAAKASGVDKTVPADIFEKNQKLREAADSGSIIDVDANSATVRNPDGTEEVLDNVAMLHFAPDSELAERYPGIAEMLRKKSLVADVADSEQNIMQRIEEAKQKVASGDYNGSIKVSMTKPGIPDGFYAEITPRLISDNYVYDSIIERKLPKGLQQAWYIGYDGVYDINSKRAMFDAAVDDPELRNAALNKMFNEWKLLNKGNSNMRFEDWLDTEITLYHGHPKGDIKDDGSGVVSFTLNKEVAKQHGDVVDEYKIKPKDTPGVLKSEWEADGIEAEGEVFLPYQLFDNDVWNEVWVADDSIQTFRGQPYRAGEDFVYNDPDYRQRLAESGARTEDLDYGYGDAYFFTTYEDWAREFGDTLVSFTFKEKDTLPFDDYTQLKDKAIALDLNEPTNYADYAKQYGAEDAELMKRIGNNSFRAAAEYTGKPVIMATEGMRGPEWLYYKGVDKEFDESATTSLLASISPEYEQASAANIEMANRIQQALDTEPYGRTIGEIVADKYKKGAATIGDAPDSSSYRWESPDVTKTYNTEAEVFADMPTGKNLTEVRQWEKNAHSFYMNRYMQETMPEFTEKYPTVDEQQQFVRNMDYLFDIQRIDGETLEVSTSEGALTSRATEDYAKSNAKLNDDIKAQKVKVKDLEAQVNRASAPKTKDIADMSDSEVVDAVAKTGKQFQENLKDAIVKWRDEKSKPALQQLGFFNGQGGRNTLHIEAASYFKHNNTEWGMSDVPGGLRGLVVGRDSAAEQRLAPKTIEDIAEDASNATGVKYTPSQVNKILNDYAVAYSGKVSGKNIKDFFAEKPDAKIVSWQGSEKGTGKAIIKREGKEYISSRVAEQIADNAANARLNSKLAAERQQLADLEKRKATAEEVGTFAPSDYKISGSAIGKTYENEGIVYAVNEDDVRFYLDTIEPIMNGLREAGAAGQGREAFTITGYLPHSDYDPTILTAEDSMQQGVLWREYTGASTTDDDGNFSTGWLNPDLTARYSTFVHNMLWDSLGDNVVVAKYMEEFNADGLNVAANTVEKMVGGRKRLAHLVSESDSVKAVVKNLLGDGELPTEAQLEKAAKDLGSTDIVHDLYRPVYGEAKGLYQTKSATSVKLMSKADWMRSLATGDGTLYDNGGAMIVNGAADAKFLAKRITDAIDNGEELDVHQMFVEYLMQNQRRTAKGADYIADKWMDKIAQKASNGGISRRAITAELNSLIYGEGANRLFRFIGRMDTSQLTSANKQALDSLLFRHSALSKIKNTSGISAQINKWTNRLISARMKSLFWLNYKNAVLQASECVRLFTEFKFGDARATIKRLATDADFRATVDEWVDMLVPERFVKSDSTAATGALDMVAEKTSFKNGEMTVNKFSADDIRKFGEKIDEFGRAPVELGETMKNRVMMAGILQEAERKGLTGNELFSYVNQRFERVGLAANEMGRLNASDSPLFRLGANLKTFQIRQFRMFLNNIHDMNGAGEAATYIIKNLGWKLGLALIMGKLGYSTAATLGLDPFDLMDDDYTGVDEENYTGLDYAMLSPVAKLFLSGGFTGYINDAYWAARKAYEDNATITEQTENQAGDNIWPGLAMPGMSFDNVFDAFSGFIPGFTAGKRVYQMNELLETGWATSASGNKMYEAPNNPFDIAAGYLFGRSNTPNARAYYQNPDYLQGLLENGLPGVAQQFGREFGGFRQFDPIDRQNYSDWFNGTAADEQQWNSGYYYFLNKVNDITDKYQNSLNGYVDDAQREELSLSYNRQIAEIEDQLNRFTTAYEAKHPDGIDANKMRNLVNVLNIYEPVLNENEADALERRRKAYNDALYRYTQAGLPAVTSYERGDEGVEAVYSPQVRAALQGRYGLPEEAAQRVKELYNDKWKKLNQQYRDRYYDTKGSKQKKAIQEEYISIVRQDLDPIVSLYGSEIFSNDTVEDIVEDVFNSMIPKYGQTAKSYLKNAYKNYHGTINYAESGNTTLSEINNLLDQGKTARAKALARTLLQRVQENRTSLTRQEMERLQAILND